MRTLAIVNGSEEQYGGWRPAREQYASPQFRSKAKYAETCDDWRIVSEKHGLFSPDARIGLDEATLASLTPSERNDWARAVRVEIKRLVVEEDNYDALVALLDSEYVRPLSPLWKELERNDIQVRIEQTPHEGAKETNESTC
ncbi:DUF6884 domain-containing protein [Haladaptatus cibarius]|uniref:DUF6884 domain-containing protein n=1 Tax=Haladaptatus cibarius TaxID=453847 RepID=UPI000678427C|nr:DUF6884 domain-containing protein [Haladaptatus cibarius]